MKRRFLHGVDTEGYEASLAIRKLCEKLPPEAAAWSDKKKKGEKKV
jgi:hypothetical protein